MFFLLLGAVSAIDSTDVSTYEDSNLDDSASALSTQDKLEISNEDSISETNLVNSHDDNLEDYPADIVSVTNNGSDYEDNGGKIQASNPVTDNNNDSLSVSSDMNASANLSTDDSVSDSSSESNVLTVDGKVPSKLTIADTTYSSSGSVFRVILKGTDGKALTGQTVTLKISGQSYTGTTSSTGVALIKTKITSKGTYTASLSYAGNSNYDKSSLSQKVKVISSIDGSNMEKEYGVVSVFKASFFKNDVALANTEITFTIAKKTYKRVTDSKGVAKLNIGLAAGKYTLVAYNPYSKESRSFTVIVYKGAATIKQTYSKPYILPDHKYTFRAQLKSTDNAPISNAKVYFKYNNKVVSALTDEAGKATIVISGLKKTGSYTITYNFNGNKNFNATSGSGKVYVHNPYYTFKSYDVNMKYNDGSKFGVVLQDNNKKPLANKHIKIKINGKVYEHVTNKNGWAGIKIGKLRPTTYTVHCTYLSSGAYNYTDCANKLKISKLDATLYASNMRMEYKDKAAYKVIVKDASGKNIKNIRVKFVILGKSYFHKTNSKGVASLNINLGVGYYSIKTIVSDAYYKSSTQSKRILVNGTKFIASNAVSYMGRDAYYSLKVIDALNNPIKNARIAFTLDGKKYSAVSNENGVAKVNLGKLSKGTHTIQFSHHKSTGSAKIKIIDRVLLKDVIKASNTVKKYIESNEKLPSSVKIGSYTYTMAQYLYIASQAIVHIKSGSTSKDVAFKMVNKPNSPQKASDLGNLYNYLDVAKSVAYYGNKYNIMPDYAHSDVGDIGYEGLVYAFARVIAFYGDNDVAPSYTAIRSLSESVGSTSNLNSRNTISNLAAYLAASTNCQVNSAKVQELVNYLTSGLTSDTAKARAIFNYVRDTVSYSFYYDTRYGAVGTLEAETGNCVDHSHALVALYRAAGLPARYVHGTCTFSSGSTYGHVWAQVLLGDTWTVSDATSSRNSLGYVANWNSNSYSLNGYYASLPF